MTAYDLLSDPIRRFVWSQKWAELRPIQVAAIEKILTTQNNFILAARTASGKTEAAFLPVLTSIKPDDVGVQVLYISPLIALINDQVLRIEELSKYLDIRITKWHGEAGRAEKMILLKDPSGILFITPESIEALFVNRPAALRHLFGNLKFVIVDELHSFLGTKRGIQLQSLLSRLRAYAFPRFLGLSATIGDYEEAREFFGAPSTTKILRDMTKQPMQWSLALGETGTNELSDSLLDAIYESVAPHKSLIFPNSRGRVEEIAVKLKSRAERRASNLVVFAHHSSVDRDIREFAETFAKTSLHRPFAIVCTSTLELGIDIGAVDKILQVDSTASVSSLAQRLGRSGRHEGQSSNLAIYVTDEWHLLQSLACVSLVEEQVLEKTERRTARYDILFHQILSVLKQTSGLPRAELVAEIISNTAFKGLQHTEIETLLDAMIVSDYVQDLRRELIVGLRAEPLVNNRDFYSVFDKEERLSVRFGDCLIGELQPTFDLQVDENIFLAARKWKIREIERERKIVWVAPANDARKPKFFGHGMNVPSLVREKMLSLLLSNTVFPQIEGSAAGQLETMRKRFRNFPMTDVTRHRPFVQGAQTASIFTFAGSKINYTLSFCFTRVMNLQCQLHDHESRIEINHPNIAPDALLAHALEALESVSGTIKEMLDADKNAFTFGKWEEHLPAEFKIQMLLDGRFDIDGTKKFCSGTTFVGSRI